MALGNWRISRRIQVMRILRIGSGIVAAGCIGLLSACSPLASDTSTRIADLERKLPLGFSLKDVQLTLNEERLPHSVFSPQDCAKNAAMTRPSYAAKGGPCVFAMARVGQTWYGYSVAVRVRLVFDSSNKLAHRDFDRVDTFL